MCVGAGSLALAEAAVVGGVAAAVVASSVAQSRTSTRTTRRRQEPPLPVQEVVLLGGTSAGVGATAQAPSRVYVSNGTLIRSALPQRGHKGRGKGKGAAVLYPQQPLNVSFVRLPAEAIEQRGDVTFFAIDVTTLSGGSVWRVMRRYSQFHALQARLGPLSRSFPDAPFPTKLIFACKDQKLEDRRRGLEVWLQRALEFPSSRGLWLRDIREFLEGGRLALALAPPESGARIAQALASAAAMPEAPSLGDDASAPPAPDEPADSVDDDDRNEGLMPLQIEIPLGVSSGQLLGVTVPDGRQLTVPVPGGFAGGATLELMYDSAAGTLTPIR